MQLLSICYQKTSWSAETPHKHWVFTILQLIRIRSCQEISKQICLYDLAQDISILFIIQIVEAIWFFVAIVLPSIWP